MTNEKSIVKLKYTSLLNSHVEDHSPFPIIMFHP